MPAKPLAQRRSPTVECVKPNVGQEWSRWRQAFHTGRVRESFRRAGILRGGSWTQASNFAQSLAEMTMLRRSRTSASAASIALRRMKSLKVVRDCAAADSSSVRSEGLTRRLRMAGDDDCGIGKAFRIGYNDHRLYYISIHGRQRQFQSCMGMASIAIGPAQAQHAFHFNVEDKRREEIGRSESLRR